VRNIAAAALSYELRRTAAELLQPQHGTLTLDPSGSCCGGSAPMS
jgi:uncharacterized protein (DUF779 family)